MLINLQWSYFDINSQQKFQWDKLIVSEDEAKTILKEAIRFWDREESFPSAGCEFPNLIKSHVKTFGFDSTIPELNAWYLEWNDKQAYYKEIEPILQSFEGMKFKNPDPFIPQIAKILTDIKKKENVNNGALQLKSLIKQIQLKKDF